MLQKTIQTDQLITHIYDTRPEMGKAAARAAADAIRQVLSEKDTANVVFAAAPSQNEMLAALAEEDVDFSCVNAFHMDEYLGLRSDDPHAFASYLNEHIWSKAPFRSVRCIPAALPAEEACAAYTGLLKQYPTDVVCMGIGENGHIAFNDPPVADFEDPHTVKAVELDPVCRMQQVHDGCFQTLDSVPAYALTMTVPALMAARYLICTVPGATKAEAVRRMLRGAVDTSCPASILRRHEHAELFLDAKSAENLL